MQRVTGLGGIFFKCEDPAAQKAWYEKHLNLPSEEEGVIFKWRDSNADKPGMTIWAPFKKDTKYFGPGPSQFMINYRVENLDALLEVLQAEGVEIDPKRDNSEYGKFAWITDPERNRIELWEPPQGQ